MNDDGKMDAFTTAWTAGLICIVGAGLAYLVGALGYALLLGVGGVAIIGVTWTKSTLSRVILVVVTGVILFALVYGLP